MWHFWLDLKANRWTWFASVYVVSLQLVSLPKINSHSPWWLLVFPSEVQMRRNVNVELWANKEWCVASFCNSYSLKSFFNYAFMRGNGNILFWFSSLKTNSKRNSYTETAIYLVLFTHTFIWKPWTGYSFVMIDDLKMLMLWKHKIMKDKVEEPAMSVSSEFEKTKFEASCQ